MLGEVDLGLEGLERVPVSASPVRLSGGRRASAHRPPPRPGEHNRQVYCGLLGYGPDRLAELRSSGLV
jgi:crotonobetainyl-CoA:carnitine CoA-transferase CaiB-like acyl-CoA transferase